MNALETVLDELAEDAPVAAPSWDDVLRRARAPRRRRLATAAVAAVVALALAIPSFGLAGRLAGLFGGTPFESQRLSGEELHVLGAMTSGVSPRLPASTQDDLARIGASSLRQIATRDGRAYFVANMRGGGLCVSIAPVGDPLLFGSIACAHDFPSASRPVFDQSAFGGSVGESQAIRLEGFAADGIKSVGLLTTSGQLTALTPVSGNVYLRTTELPNEPVAAIVGVDTSGHRVYTECLVAAGCEIARRAQGRTGAGEQRGRRAVTPVVNSLRARKFTVRRTA